MCKLISICTQHLNFDRINRIFRKTSTFKSKLSQMHEIIVITNEYDTSTYN